MQYQDSFRKLIAWQQAKVFVNVIYKVTISFPREEVFGLTSQMRRAAVSVAANLAEGNSRKNQKERRQFFFIAKSSLTEVDCLAEIAFDQGFLVKDAYANLLEQLNKTAFLVSKLITAINRNDP